MSDAPPTMIRAFVAVNLPPGIKAGLEHFQRGLKETLRSDVVRWTPPEQVHLTLRFFGDIAADSVADLEAALRRACAGARPFELAAEGFGCFPDFARPRILWIGVTGGLDLLEKLAGKIVAETQVWGKREEKPLHPHLTIGRVKAGSPVRLRGLSGVLESVQLPALGEWLVEGVDLMQSRLSPGGALHSRLEAIGFGESPAGQVLSG